MMISYTISETGQRIFNFMFERPFTSVKRTVLYIGLHSQYGHGGQEITDCISGTRIMVIHLLVFIRPGL